MATNVRSILVDDSDDGVIYQGTWVVNQGKDFDIVGTNGRAFGPTVHAASVDASMAYTFQGTAGQIMGTTMINNRSNVFSPTWTCSIDGTQIQTEAITVSQNNNWPFCKWSGLSDGSHTVTLNISSSGNPFYFDWLSFVPSTARTRPSGTPETIIIPATDSAITYDSSWTNLPDPLVGKSTSTSNSSVTVSFSGSSIVWYAVAPSGTATAPSKGRIRIDDRDTYPFSIPGLTAPTSPSLFNQQYFQVANLSQGTHTLTVTYDGDASSMPLTLSSVVVTDPPQQPPAKKIPIGIIVGGVVGGVVLIVFIALAVWYLMRKPGKRKLKPVEPENIIQPFNVPPTVGPSTAPSLRTMRSTTTRDMTLSDTSRGPVSASATSPSVSGSGLLPGNASFTSSVPSSQQPLSLSSRDRKTPVSSSSARRGHRPQQPSTTDTAITSSSTTPSSTHGTGGERRRANSGRRRHQVESTISEMPPAYTPG